MPCRVSLALALMTLVPAAFAPAAEIHVAPNGDDANPGTAARPVATLTRARDAARAVIAKGLTGDLRVVVHGGTYRLTKPLVLGPQDGGTEEHAVRWREAEGTSPVISGGRMIAGWKQDGEVWRTTVPKVKAGEWRFNELFVGGERRPRARHPNEDWARVDSVVDDRWKFTWKEGEVPALAEPGEAQLLLLHDWSVTRVRIASMDSGSRTLTTADRIGGPARFWRINGFEPHPRYRIENHPALLDAPGEWYLDAKSGVLTYRPMPGETIGKTETIAPVAPQLLVVRGEEGKPVRNLHLRGLVFEHALWMPAGGRYAGMQACFHWEGEAREKDQWGSNRPVTPALEFTHAEGCTLTGCCLRRLGGSGVWFGGACNGGVLRASVVEDVAGNGVMVGEGRNRQGPGVATGNRIENARILRCGRRFFGAVGVWVGITDGTVITRSEIAHHPYTGVSVGWQWNPNPTPCRNNRVVANHIHHCMQILSDGGGIYTLGRQPGTRLAQNHIHDIPLNVGRAESNGMFLDEGTTEIVIEGNLIYDTVRSPLRFHKARENLVKDNIVTLREGVPIVRYNATDPKHITLKDNTVIPHDDRGTTFKKALERMRREAGPPHDR
jgi:hypothetical protein